MLPDGAVAREVPSVPAASRPSSVPRSVIYAGIGALVAAVCVALAPPQWPASDQLFVPLSAAVLVGGLLSVRLGPNRAPVTLVLVPLLVAYERLGPGALFPLVVATALGSLVRGGRDARIVAEMAHAVIAFQLARAVSDLAATSGYGVVVAAAGFGVTFALARFALWLMGRRLGDLVVEHGRVERPDPLLPLVLAPLAAIPLLVGAQLGDGALLLALAALLAMLFIVREATNLAAARAEVEVERDRLARANALQDELLHLMTHQLKNPLTAVLARSQLAQLALSRGDTERLPRHLAIVEESAKLIQRLVDNLLQLSQIEQSGSLPPSERVNVVAVADEVRGELQPLAEQKEQSLALDGSLDPGSEVWVLAPPLLLREVISNLISNSIKYTPAGGSVTIRAARSQSGQTAEVSVIDTGIGMSDEDLTRLFSKFFRGTNPKAREQTGTGLGLALTHAIVLRMGGKIRVNSALNQGSTFTIDLPAPPR